MFRSKEKGCIYLYPHEKYVCETYFYVSDVLSLFAARLMSIFYVAGQQEDVHVDVSVIIS